MNLRPQNSKTAVYFWQQISHPDGITIKNRRCGNSNKLKVMVCAAGCAGGKGTFDSVLNLAVKFRWPTQQLLWPLRNLVWPSRGPYGQLWEQLVWRKGPHWRYKGKAVSVQSYYSHTGFQEVHFSTVGTWMWEIFEHTQQLTSPSGNISGTHFCHSLSPSQSHIVAGRIM